jgi:hypothetical protein
VVRGGDRPLTVLDLTAASSPDGPEALFPNGVA